MDKQEYLNEISASTRPAAPSNTHKFLSSKFLWVGIIGVLLLIIIIVIGSLLSGSNTSTKDRVSSLILHLDNTTEVIKEYQPYVKSSDLRSYSASLSGILSNTSSSLTTYATNKYNFKPKEVNKSIVEEETSYKDALISDLFNAKITGSLDQVYAQKLAIDISLIQSRETQLIKSSSLSDLQDDLRSSYDSLTNLYDKFNNFSESK